MAQDSVSETPRICSTSRSSIEDPFFADGRGRPDSQALDEFLGSAPQLNPPSKAFPSPPKPQSARASEWRHSVAASAKRIR